jgi:hypothetical protein
MKEMRSSEMPECVKLPATWRNIPKDQQLTTLLQTRYQSEGKGIRTDKESPLGNNLAL